MTKKPRNYAQEYARRIELGRKRGHSRARSRGHAPPLNAARRKDAKLQERLEAALQAFRTNQNIARSAKAAKVSPERFRQFLRANKLARKREGRWSIREDKRPREIEMLATTGWKRLIVPGLKPASEIGKHRAAVRAFKDSGDEAVLAPFVGKSVLDTTGKSHEFETRPNMLLRQFKTGRGSFENVYKLVSV